MNQAETLPSFPPLLRRALLANAAFSAASALAFCTLHQPLSAWMGLQPAWLLLATGIGLLGFAAYVALTGLRAQVDTTAIWAIITGDLGWVAGSFALLGLFPEFLNHDGQLLVWLVAAVVFLFAVLQAIGLQRAARD